MVVVPASYALNLAHSPNSTQTKHSSSFCCPTLGTAPCDLWPVAAELFPVTQPSDLSSLPLHLGDCGHFYLNNVCSVIPLVTKNHTLPWIVYTQDSLHVLSHLGAISLRAVILFIRLLHHTAPVSIFYTVNSGQVLSKILSVGYEIGFPGPSVKCLFSGGEAILRCSRNIKGRACLEEIGHWVKVPGGMFSLGHSCPSLLPICYELNNFPWPQAPDTMTFVEVWSFAVYCNANSLQDGLSPRLAWKRFQVHPLKCGMDDVLLRTKAPGSM